MNALASEDSSHSWLSVERSTSIEASLMASLREGLGEEGILLDDGISRLGEMLKGKEATARLV